MKYFHTRVFRLCCTACLLLFTLSSSGQKVKDFLLGTWLGYITIDGKPAFKVSILTGENEDKTFVAGIYYYPFTKNGDAFRYDTVKLNINEHDTSASFDMAIPKITGGNYCKGKVIVRRPNLYTMQIASRYLPYQNCQQVALFINEPQTMLKDAVFSGAPDIAPVLTKNDHPEGGQTPKVNHTTIPADLVGGDTPDMLGRTMLKALQTNNKKLWAGCIHPTYDLERDPQRRQRVIDQFDEIRADFAAKGISDWNQVTFSRSVADVCNTCAAPGEKWLSELVVEFWYQGREFLCKISFTPAMTYKGKYYVGRNYDHAMIRYRS